MLYIYFLFELLSNLNKAIRFPYGSFSLSNGNVMWDMIDFLKYIKGCRSIYNINKWEFVMQVT